MKNYFILPTLACNASCRYCFTRSRKSPVMIQETIIKALDVIRRVNGQSYPDDINICFHGGEPLMVGFDFYKKALPVIKKTLGPSVKLSIQSNLWQLTDEFCNLFMDYNVNIGTSLDGPEQINDNQRGRGYFKRTMAGIELLHKYGLNHGCIATFTSYSASRIKEVFDFFLKNRLSFSVHSAVKPINYSGDSRLFLSAEEFGKLLIRLLDLYLDHADKIKISTLDTLIKNVSRDESGLCTFSRCIGDYLSITPEGKLYPCNRFAGDNRFSFGSIETIDSLSDIKQSEGWKKLAGWQHAIDSQCSECLYENICHGGCPYAAFAHQQTYPPKDPYCPAYKKVYQYILDRGTYEFFKNLNPEQESRQKKEIGKSSFFKKSTLLRIMDDSSHPYKLARASKEILAAALLGVTGDIKQIADAFLSFNLTNSRQRAYPVLQNLCSRLNRPTFNPNNLYLHITDMCNLSCSHCYARAQNTKDAVHFPLRRISSVINEAKKAGFRKIVITGGEPLLYSDFNLLLEEIMELRKSRGIPPIVLRTNLTTIIKKETRELIETAFDEIVISLDGSEEYHDKRRGKGTYQKTLSNLRSFNQEVLSKKFSITSVFGSNDFNSSSIAKEKQSVYQVKEKLQLSRVRIRSMLPLGRATSLNLKRIPVEKINLEEWVQSDYFPRSNCGLGQVLMINPDGSVYPCHVFAHPEYHLGNILEQSISELVNSQKYKDLRSIGVNSDKKCKKCQLRYICGGPCRAWGNKDCTELYERALTLLMKALKTLGISKEEIREYGVTY